MAKQNEIEKQELQRKLDEVISNKACSDSHFKHFEDLTQSVEEYQQTVEKSENKFFLKKKVEGRGGG